MSEATAPVCQTCGGPLPHNDLACVRHLGERVAAMEAQIVNFITPLQEDRLRWQREARQEGIAKMDLQLKFKRSFEEQERLLRELKEVKEQLWFGLATTGQLLAELRARAEVGGYAEYRAVGDESGSDEG